MKYLLGLDNGGTKTKCAVYDIEGNELSVASQNLPLDTPHVGWTERDPGKVWQANCEVIRQAVADAGIDPADIIGLGLTGYGNGACFVDEEGVPVYPCIVSTDSRANGYLDQWEKDGTMQKVYELTYQKIWDAQPAALIPWFRDNRPDVLEKTRYTLDMKDYIRFRLTGELVSEITAASSGCLMNIKTLEFDKEIFKLLDIEKYFGINPPYVGSTDISGRITKEASISTGIPEGVPVSGGYFDIDAGALASGVLDEQTLCCIAGTWSINEYISSDLESNYGKFSNTVGYLPGWYTIEDSSPTSASNLEWFLDRFYGREKEELGGALFKQCDEAVDAIAPEESDIIFVPYLYASATHPKAKSLFFGVSGYHKKEHLLRAVYEGVAFSTAFHVERLTKGKDVDYRLVRFSGGAANARVWTQMFCDVLNMPIETLKSGELSAMGAAMSAGIACGAFADEHEAVERMVQVKDRFEPDPDRAESYRKKFCEYKKVLAMMDSFYVD